MGLPRPHYHYHYDYKSVRSCRMRVALAHDYLTQRGGAERVALEFTKVFGGSPLHTSVYAPEQTFSEFRAVDVRTTWLQHLPIARRDPRLLLPAMAAAWASQRVDDADVVLASSTGFAHGIPVSPGIRKVVYCHNPPRWLYQTQEYLPSRLARGVLGTMRPWLQRWDERAAGSADVYLANSTAVRQRVRQAYGIDARVVHPPVLVDPSGRQEPVEGVEPGYWLVIARGRGYKNVQEVADAVGLLKGERLVVAGSGSGSVVPRPGVQAVGVVSEEQLRWLYANARALVSISFEDFGLTPIEANAYGTPVAVLRAGGFLDSTDEGRSGVFIEEPTARSVASALSSFPDFDRETVRANADRFSPAAFAASLRRAVSAGGIDLNVHAGTDVAGGEDVRARTELFGQPSIAASRRTAR